MGTSLTGLTPSTTYDALIKVGDNGALSATAKVLSDGLGNDSPLAMSTTLVGIGTASPVRKLTVSGADDGELQLRLLGNASTDSYAELGRESMSTGQFRIKLSRNGTVITPLVIDDVTGNVGIGTTSPTSLLEIRSVSFPELRVNDGTITYQMYASTGGSAFVQGTVTNQPIIFRTNSVERIRITNDGLTFNGDTSASNALDDYEEGQWTMGMSFGGGTTGITYTTNAGTYTKIGRTVTVNGILSLSSKGSSTGDARITGLPFTIANGAVNYASASFRLNNVTFLNQFQGYGEVGATTIVVEEITSLGATTPLGNADFANNSDVIISMTYFV